MSSSVPPLLIIGIMYFNLESFGPYLPSGFSIAYLNSRRVRLSLRFVILLYIIGKMKLCISSRGTFNLLILAVTIGFE